MLIKIGDPLEHIKDLHEDLGPIDLDNAIVDVHFLFKPDNDDQEEENNNDKKRKREDESSPEEKPRANSCLLYTSPSPRDRQKSRMPSSA